METIPSNMQIAISAVIAAASLGLVIYAFVYDKLIKNSKA